MKLNVKYTAAVLVAAVLYLTAGAALAALEVNVMPSGVTSKVNSWDSGPYTAPGNALELWGNVAYDGSDTLEYSWSPGCGAQATPFVNVADASNIARTHTYTALGSCVAVLTVKEVNGTQSDSDTVFIDVLPNDFELELNLTRQRALKYIYMTKVTQTLNNCTAYYIGSYRQAFAGFAALAFQDYGHSEWNDKTKDIYAETVEGFMNYILYYMGVQATSDTPVTFADINNNDRMLYPNQNHGRAGYTDGIIPLAIAHSVGRPNETVRDCAATAIVGDTYQTVVEDLLDHIAYAQYDNTTVGGGWRYSDNSHPDNSAVQWPTLALSAAEQAPWNIIAPAWVKSKLAIWINYSQNANGGFGYTTASGPNVLRTGSGIAEMTYAGSGGNLNNALNYIDNNWAFDNVGRNYAMYAVKKGLQSAGLTQLGSHDWQQEYNEWYVNNQVDSGTNGSWWSNGYWFASGNQTSAFAALVMAPGLTQLPPVAVAGVDQQVPENTDVDFDGSNSYHSDLARVLVEYQWDFDFDGVNFDIDATGVAVTRAGGYAITNGTATQTYTVGLRVLDDNNPALQDTDTLSVEVSNGNIAPVAVPGGPYTGVVGANIVLNGSNSWDANEAGGTNPIANATTTSGFDEIVRFQWDLDGDGVYGTDDLPVEPEGASPTVNFGPTFIGTKTIGLKVTDSFGATAAQSSDVTTVAVSDLYPHSYVLVSNIYNRRTRNWTVTWKVNITNAGTAAATEVSAILTGDNIPAGVTVTDSTVSWTNPDGSIDPNEVQLSGDADATFTYTYPRSVTGPDVSLMTWDIELTDALGTRHVIRSIPQ